MSTAILGHRGASALALENTLEAFALALDRGADGVELDVQLSADGEVVVFHDRELDRLVLGESGPVRARTWKELSAMRLGDGANGDGASIPRLHDVLEALPAHGIVNVELKSFGDPKHDLVLCEKVAPLVAGRERLVLSSFSLEIVRRLVADGLPEPTLIIEQPRDEAQPGALADLGVRGLHLWDGLVEPGAVEALLGDGLAVGVWTVNDLERRRALVDLGVTRIITDDP